LLSTFPSTEASRGFSVPSHNNRGIAHNGDYQRADKLANPVIDARRLRDALTKLHFEIVYDENLDKQRRSKARSAIPKPGKFPHCSGKTATDHRFQPLRRCGNMG
jgi:hypothetical protein